MDLPELPVDLSNIPMMVAPNRIEPDFGNPFSIGPRLTTLSVIFRVLMGLYILIRLYTQIFIRNSWGLDNWLCMPAVIAASSILICQKFGPHSSNVPVSALTPALIKNLLVVAVIYSPTILMAKLSLLFLYWRIFRPNVRLRYSIYLRIVLDALFYISIMVGFFIIYMPRKRESVFTLLYKPRKGESLFALLYKPIDSTGVGLTIAQSSLATAQSAVNVASDIYILCLPIAGIWQLQAALSKKIGLSAIFMTGILACVSSVVVLWYRVGFDAWGDVTYNLVPVLIWVIFELTAGVICGCLPSFPGFFRRHFLLLRSIVSRFGSKPKEIIFKFRKRFRPQSESSSASKSKGILRTKDIRINFGTQIDSDGHFLNPQSVSAREENWSWLKNLADESPELNATRRAWHERQQITTEKSQISHDP